jgi:predicted metal-dependent hydrolase
MTKELFIEGIGDVRITKKRGVKRLTLSVRPFRPVNVTMPYSLSFDDALKFIRQKQSWISDTRSKIAQIEHKRVDFDTETTFKTKFRELVFVPSDKTRVKLTATQIVAEYQNKTVFANSKYQDYIRKALTETLRMEAKRYLPERTAYLAKLHGFTYNKISVRNARTRWGSCSGKNDISLNIHLMRLPDSISDYVILHELCHTKEKNHGKGFWAILDKVTGNAKGMDKALNSYRLSF